MKFLDDLLPKEVLDAVRAQQAAQRASAYDVVNGELRENLRQSAF